MAILPSLFRFIIILHFFIGLHCYSLRFVSSNVKLKDLPTAFYILFFMCSFLFMQIL